MSFRIKVVKTGVNLRTNQSGIFPSLFATDLEPQEEKGQEEKELYGTDYDDLSLRLQSLAQTIIKVALMKLDDEESSNRLKETLDTLLAPNAYSINVAKIIEMKGDVLAGEINHESKFSLNNLETAEEKEEKIKHLCEQIEFILKVYNSVLEPDGDNINNLTCLDFFTSLKRLVRQVLSGIVKKTGATCKYLRKHMKAVIGSKDEVSKTEKSICKSGIKSKQDAYGQNGASAHIRNKEKKPCVETFCMQLETAKAAKTPITLELLREAAARAGAVIKEMFRERSNNADPVLTYMLLFPGGCRMALALPTLKGSYIHQKDELDRTAYARQYLSLQDDTP